MGASLSSDSQEQGKKLVRFHFGKCSCNSVAVCYELWPGLLIASPKSTSTFAGSSEKRTCTKMYANIILFDKNLNFIF